MDYFYNIEITRGYSVNLREISLDSYKNLQKMCVERDSPIFSLYIRELIEELSIHPITFELNVIDIVIICLTMRIYSVDHEKTFITHRDGIKGNLNVPLGVIIGKIRAKYVELSTRTVISVVHQKFIYIIYIYNM